MRSLFTALAFAIILWAIIPAVKRSLLPPKGPRHDGRNRTTNGNQRP
jgi:hypothetical protein